MKTLSYRLVSLALALLQGAALSQASFFPSHFRGFHKHGGAASTASSGDARDVIADTGSEASLVSDAEALLQFKDSIARDPYGYLDSWHDTAGVCEWRGIACTDQRVTSVVLSDSGFHGTLSDALGSLTALKALIVSNGFLTGPIPRSLKHLIHIQVLDLSMNRLTGGMPSFLCRLPDLSFLHLADNQLAGHIPEKCSAIAPAADFNVAHNHLEGPIPGGRLAKLPRRAFEGNLGLCGLPLALCGDEQVAKSTPHHARPGDDWASARPVQMPPVPQLQIYLATAGGLLAVAAVLAGVFVTVRMVSWHCGADSPFPRVSPRRGHLRSLTTIAETSSTDAGIMNPLLVTVQAP